MSLRPRSDQEEPFDFQIDRFAFRLANKELIGEQPHDIDPVPFLAQQTSTSDSPLSYDDVDRSVEVPIPQSQFIGGLGKTPYFSADTKHQFRYSKGADTSSPTGVVLPGPLVHTLGGAVMDQEPRVAVQRGDITYVAAGTKLWQVTDLTTVTLDTTFADVITDLFVYQNKLLVGFSAAGGTNCKYRVSNTIGGAFTDIGLAGSPFKGTFFMQVLNVLWIADDTNNIYALNSVTGLRAPYVIGDSGDPVFSITDIAAFGDEVMVGRSDGPWLLDTDGIAHALMPDLRLQAFPTVCSVLQVYNGRIHFPTRHGVVAITHGFRYRPDELEEVGFNQYADPQLPGLNGVPEFRPGNLATEGRYLYAIVDQFYNGANAQNGIYIWKRDRAGAWHNYVHREDLGLSARLLFCSPKLGSVDFTNAVLFAYRSGGPGTNYQLAWSRYPAVADPTKDSAYEFDNVHTSVLRTLDFTANLPTIQKVAARLKVIADKLQFGVDPIDVYVYEDDNPARKIGTFVKSPFQEKHLQVPASFFRASLEFRFKAGATLDLTKIPQLRGFHLTTRFLPRVVRKHTVKLALMDQEPLQTGGRLASRQGYGQQGSWKEQLRRLRELRRTKAIVDVRDEHGYRFPAYLDDLSERVITAQASTQFEPTKVVVVVLHEVAVAD